MTQAELPGRHRRIPVRSTVSEILPTVDAPYAGITHSGLLSWLHAFRGEAQGGSVFYLADILAEIADQENLGEYSYQRDNLTHHLRREFVKSGIVQERKEPSGRQRHLVDDTGADILVGLAFEYSLTEYGVVHIEQLAQNLYERVRDNSRLAAPLVRFLEEKRSGKEKEK